jgi:hypothetical protein
MNKKNMIIKKTNGILTNYRRIDKLGIVELIKIEARRLAPLQRGSDFERFYCSTNKIVNHLCAG